jgi:hypothetical protein
MTRTHTYTILDNDETIMRRYSQTITFIRRIQSYMLHRSVCLKNVFDTMLADVVFTFFSLLFRFASDQVEHGYAVSVSNVFDTMLADVVFTIFLYYSGLPVISWSMGTLLVLVTCLTQCWRMWYSPTGLIRQPGSRNMRAATM